MVSSSVEAECPARPPDCADLRSCELYGADVLWLRHVPRENGLGCFQSPRYLSLYADDAWQAVGLSKSTANIEVHTRL